MSASIPIKQGWVFDSGRTMPKSSTSSAGEVFDVETQVQADALSMVDEVAERGKALSFSKSLPSFSVSS